MSRNAIPFLMPLLLCVGSYSALTFPAAIFNFALKMYSGSMRLVMEASMCSFFRFAFPLNRTFPSCMTVIGFERLTIWSFKWMKNSL